jgi:hypothetical protein
MNAVITAVEQSNYRPSEADMTGKTLQSNSMMQPWVGLM